MCLLPGRKLLCISAIAACWLTQLEPSQAQFFSDDFDDFNASTRFSAPFYSSEVPGVSVFDGTVDFAFDYSTVGVAPAPSSNGTTIGLGFKVNIFDDGAIDEGEAIAVSPIIASLPSDYRIRGEIFIYYGSGAGASEHAVLGINSDQSAVPFAFVPQGPGVTYHFPHDSGLSDLGTPDDYYRNDGGTTTGLYGDAPSLGLPDPELLNIPFVGVDPIFDDPGYPGNRWFKVELTHVAGQVTVLVEGVVIDQFDASGQTAADILIGAADIFNSVNATNWIIWDNVVVEEPALGLVGDYNNDDTVDAADYVVWRKDPNSYGGTQGYTDWVGNFGQTAGSGSSDSNTSVPEPATVVVVLIGVCMSCVGRNRYGAGVTSTSC